jgi:uncharacterized protein (DUF1800 family)
MRTETVIAANRFGLGARPGELATIGADPRGWLTEQIRGTTALPAAVSGLDRSANILRSFQAVRQQKSDRKDVAMARDPLAPVRDVLQPAYRSQAEARYLVATQTDQPFRERLVHFWTNHFAVSADKPPVTGLAGSLENEVIRPHVTGRFVDMLLAVERHPAMLLYLDNQGSIGPGSTLARRGAWFGRSDRRLDINENLGREILELHTLGVNAGYTQTDVTAFSKVLTGWSLGGREGRLRGGTPGEFFFREIIHEPGPQTLLGKTYAQEGLEQGEAVLRDLAAHPATARHVAEKLVRHFVADEPPPAVVERVAGAFIDSDGDLTAVYQALIDSPEAWTTENAKFKTPSDFLVSSIRALDVVPDQPRKLLGSLMVLGQPPYRPGSPAGWPDTAKDWAGADALMKRIEWSATVAARAGPELDPLDLAQSALGPLLGTLTRTALGRAESRQQALTLLLVSPDFQRR